jgi:hypothetical protein
MNENTSRNLLSITIFIAEAVIGQWRKLNKKYEIGKKNWKHQKREKGEESWRESN